MISYTMTGFEESREVDASLGGSASFVDNGDNCWYLALAITVMFSRSIGNEWSVDMVEVRGESNRTLWTEINDKSIPVWVREFVENFWPRPKNVIALASDGWSGSLVSDAS